MALTPEQKLKYKENAKKARDERKAIFDKTVGVKAQIRPVTNKKINNKNDDGLGNITIDDIEKVNKVKPKITEEKKKLYKENAKKAREAKNKQFNKNVGIKKVAKKKKVIKKEKVLPKNHYIGTTIFYAQAGEKFDETEFKKKYKHVHIVTHQGIKYIQRTKPLTFNIQNNGDIMNFKGKQTYKYNYVTPDREFGVENEDFYKLREMLKDDEDIKEVIKTIDGSHGFEMIVILNNIKEFVKEHNSTKIDLKDAVLFNEFDSNVIAHKYIDYKFNKNAVDFHDLFLKPASTEYVLENQFANSCFLNLIVDTFKPSFDKAVEKRRLSETLTYKKLLTLLNYSNKTATQSIGLTINQARIFFETYRLSLVCMDTMGRIFCEYRPEKQNKDIFPGILYITVHNSHCYRLTKEIASLSHTYTFDQKYTDEIQSLSVSNTFYLRPEPIQNKVFKVKCLTEIKDILIEKYADVQDETTVTFIYEDVSLDKLLCDLVLNQKCTPKVTFDKCIQQIMYSIDKLQIRIISVEMSLGEGEIVCVDDEKQYEQYIKSDYSLYQSLMNKRFISTFHDDTIKVIDTYPINPLVCTFTNDSYCSVNSFDKNKAYTDNLIHMKFVPVYNVFDTWTTYDKHKIEDYTQYLVECTEDSPIGKIVFDNARMGDTVVGIDREDIDSVKYDIIFDKTYCRVYGLVLKQIDIKYKIYYFWRPSKLIPFHGKQIFDKLFENEILSIEQKKFIANSNMGLMEKKKNKVAVSKIFNDFNELTYYQAKYGGKEYIASDNERSVYILRVKQEARLINGFTPIKDFIYSYQRLELYKLFNKMNAQNIKMIGIKTDCILTNIKEEEAISKGFKFDDAIGGLKFEKNKSPSGHLLTRTPNELLNIPQYYDNILPINDEFDKTEMKGILETNNKTALFGKYPGVGKTTAVQQLKEKILFVTPYNKLSKVLKKEGFDACTLCKLLGMLITGEVFKKTAINKTDYTTICFDEILLYAPSNLQLIYMFMRNNPDYKYYCTGDLKQLPPIDSTNYSKIQKMSEYLNKCISVMFPNKIVLKVNKRLKTQEDRDKLENIMNDIFDPKTNIVDMFKKYGFKTINNFKDLVTTDNIAFFNYRRKIVNKYVYNNLIENENNEDTYQFGNYTLWKGFKLTCIAHHKINNELRLTKNNEYVLEFITKKGVFIKDPDTDELITLPNNEKTYKLFDLPFASTCHCVQGTTIKDKQITIFDSNTPYCSREWIWTAITRVNSFDNATIFIHDDIEVQSLSNSKKLQYFKFKIQSYIEQDKVADRTFEKDDFITVDWINEELMCYNACGVCGEEFTIELENGDVKSNITVDRLQNDIAHVKSNCQLLCHHCNIVKR